MDHKTELTISDAVTAYEIVRSTLHSWVRNKKIKSRKTPHGKKEIIVVDVASLEAHLEARGASKGSNPDTKPESADEQAAVDDSDTDSPPSPASGGNTNRQSKRKGRKKPHIKTPRQCAKNMMRSFSVEDLLNVQSWITQRLQSRLSEVQEAAAK